MKAGVLIWVACLVVMQGMSGDKAMAQGGGGRGGGRSGGTGRGGYVASAGQKGARDDGSQSGESGVQGQRRGDAKKARLLIVDTHCHWIRGDQDGKGRSDTGNSIRMGLNRRGVGQVIMMPPPFGIEEKIAYDYESLAGMVKSGAGSIFFLGGGGSLNVMIQKALDAGRTSKRVKDSFGKRAEMILAAGAIGFGEMGLEVIGSGTNRPHLYAPADHDLLKMLSDIAAKHDVPVVVHMEAVQDRMVLPEWLKSPPNPEMLMANIAGFERLLAHNRKTRIVWAHAGWDNTGRRNVDLDRRLLAKHSNLYMSIKLSGTGRFRYRPINHQKRLKQAWVKLIEEFPERFMMGSDSMLGGQEVEYTGGADDSALVTTFLSEELVNKVASENAATVYSLPKLDGKGRD